MTDIQKTADQHLLELIADEVTNRAMDLLDYTEKLNRYSNITARADCLRLLRAAIELAPTLPPG